MSVGVNNTIPHTYSATNPAKATEIKEKPEVENTGTVAPKTDSYKVDIERVSAMKSELKNNMLAFKQMVFALMGEQGGFASDSLKSLVEIDEETRRAAQEAISENGYWGVEQTAQRILDFAKALSGGDPSAIAELKDAVMKGFGAAEKAWGGKLPDISYQTLERIKKGFDDWENEGKV